jgi:hypothetical protein
MRSGNTLYSHVREVRAPACALIAHLIEDASMLLYADERRKFADGRLQSRSAVGAVQAG